MSEFEIAIALFDFIKRMELTEEQQQEFDSLREAWNDLQDDFKSHLFFVQIAY